MASYLSYRNVLLSNSTVIASTLNAGSVSYSTLTESTMSSRGLNVSTLTGSTITISTLSGSTINVSTLTGSTIQGTTVFFSTMTASTILTAGSTISLARNVNVPNRFVEVGCDLADSMYLDFHSKDSALPDYSTRIISLGGATTGTGALNMYASTIGLVATNGVGIGITNPRGLLEILGNIAPVATPETTNASATTLILTRAPGTNLDVGHYIGRIAFSGADYNWIPQKIGADISAVASAVNYTGLCADIVFGTLTTQGDANPTEKMRITRSGNVGIGTTVINYPLQIGTAGAIIRIGGLTNQGSAADTTTYGLERSRNQIQFSGYRDALTDKIAAKIVAINKQTYGGVSVRQLIQSTDLAFFTVPPDTSDLDNTVERMRITDMGNVGIGTTNPISALQFHGKTAGGFWNNSCLLLTNGINTTINETTNGTSIQLTNGANSKYFNIMTYGYSTDPYSTLYITSNSTSNLGVILNSGGQGWGTYSDSRMKIDVTPLSSALSSIIRLNPVSYLYDVDPTENTHIVTRIGFLADEVDQIYPNLVTKNTGPNYTNSKGETFQPMTLCMTDLIPYLTKGIQELASQATSSAAQIQELAGQTAQLSAENAELKSQLALLEARLTAAGL